MPRTSRFGSFLLAVSLGAAPAFVPLLTVDPASAASHDLTLEERARRAPAAMPSPGALAPVAPATIASGADGTWYPVPLPAPPDLGPLEGHTMVFDTLHQKFVIFGGLLTNQVWTRAIDASAPWVLETVAGTPPSPRFGHSAVYDATAQRMLVFGGNTDGSSAVQNDLWQLDFSTTPPTWSLLATTGTPPSARVYHTAVFDPVRRRMVVFGGVSSSANNETWFLDCTTSPPHWQLAAVVGSPPTPRWAHSAIFDPVQDRMVLFGGFTPAPPFGLSDVWTLSMTSLAWVRVRETSDPDVPTSNVGGAYEPLGHRMFVTNGELWSLDLDSFEWTRWGSEPGNLRWDGAFALDPSGHHGLLNGGAGFDETLDGTWALTVDDDPVWSPGVTVARRNRSTGVYDPLRDRFLMFGGEYDGYPLADISELRMGHDSSWVQVMPSAPFGRRTALGSVYDPVRDRVIVFGGFDGSTLLDDTWIVQLSPSLTVTPAVVTGGPPLAREEFSAIYDPVRDRIVIFGGYYGGSLGDVWALNLSPSMSWSLLTPTSLPGPSARRLHAAVYDPYGDRMLMFAGAPDNDVADNELWALSLAGVPAWTQLTPLGPPPTPRIGHTFVLDPNRQRALVFGSTAMADVWELKLAEPLAWHALSPAGTAPPRRAFHMGAFDSRHDRLLVTGGRDWDVERQDVWRLQFVSDVPTAVEPSATTAFSLAGFRPNPATREMRVSFSLADLTPATIDVVDVGGRRVASRRIEAPTPGAQTIAIAPAGQLAPGLYFVKLTQGSRTLVTRGTVMR